MENRPSNRLVSFRLMLLLFWCGVIFSFSHTPGSGAPYDPPLWYVLERKSAHVFEYAVLTLLAIRFFSARYSRDSFARVVFAGALFAFAYGVLDEIHQLFIFGRNARLTDVVVDGLGIALAIALLAFVRRRRQ